ncbi:MAG: DUF723 domain-containing protein [Candidatus Thiothrix putei]|uniref:DUF723 domain-containing protein n=1 Tax=Candidatus Thiothrix putei TaxID=3080811 RepID=A0AA95KNF7_9GAMM|nr:MAG: DUF723 domain-containing protein [Candidatus Thiothrix putei]
MRKLTTKEFIKRSREVHSDRYDYSKVEYVNNKTKVVIICPEHGDFEQSPNSHLSGIGCPHCANESKKLTQESFIQKANEVHDNKYDYSKVEYTHSATKVEIICPIHGAFEQTSYNHLRGSGCPHCGYENTGWTKAKFIDICESKK